MAISDLCNIIDASGSRLVFCSEKFFDAISDALARQNSSAAATRMTSLPLSRSVAKQPPELSSSDVASIIYTSGTTGHSKGVALTHANLLSNVDACAIVCDIQPHDDFLLILPLHHTFACTVSLLLPMAMGARVTLATSYRSRDLIDDINISKATVLAAVPQLFDGMMSGILRAVESAGKSKRVLFTFLRAVSRSLRRLGLNPGYGLFKSLRQRAGVDTVRLFVSGGAALPAAVNEFFEDLGMTLTQGYGLTECSPVLAVNPASKNKIGSVGPALPGVSLKIDSPDQIGVGEVLARGPNIMQGYFENIEATEAIRSGEWLRTGDLGYLDEDGYLFLTGRLKNLIVTHAGKNVYPEEIETKLRGELAIAEVLILTSKKGNRDGDTLCCLIRPNIDYLQSHHPNDSPDDVVGSVIREYNKHVPAYQKIREWRILDGEFSKTSTGKIKRFLYADEFA